MSMHVWCVESISREEDQNLMHIPIVLKLVTMSTLISVRRKFTVFPMDMKLLTHRWMTSGMYSTQGMFFKWFLCSIISFRFYFLTQYPFCVILMKREHLVSVQGCYCGLFSIFVRLKFSFSFLCCHYIVMTFLLYSALFYMIFISWHFL